MVGHRLLVFRFSQFPDESKREVQILPAELWTYSARFEFSVWIFVCRPITADVQDFIELMLKIGIFCVIYQGMGS